MNAPQTVGAIREPSSGSRSPAAPAWRASHASCPARNPGFRVARHIAAVTLCRAEPDDANLAFPERFLSWNHASLASGPASPRPPARSVGATGRVGAIGHEDANALAAEVLDALGLATSVPQCRIFAYEFGTR